MDLDEAVQSFVAITGADVDVAQRTLEATGHDLEGAVNLFFASNADDGPPPLLPSGGGAAPYGGGVEGDEELAKLLQGCGVVLPAGCLVSRCRPSAGCGGAAAAEGRACRGCSRYLWGPLQACPALACPYLPSSPRHRTLPLPVAAGRARRARAGWRRRSGRPSPCARSACTGKTSRPAPCAPAGMVGWRAGGRP